MKTGMCLNKTRNPQNTIMKHEEIAPKNVPFCKNKQMYPNYIQLVESLTTGLTSVPSIIPNPSAVIVHKI